MNVTFTFDHYNEVVMFVFHSIRFPACLCVLLRLVDPMAMLRPDIRLVVLYSRCRVNRDTNMSVFYVLCSFYCFHCARLGSLCGVPNLGRISTEL